MAAFAVLAHGALENYFEGVCLWALNTVPKVWIARRRPSRSLACLLLHVGSDKQEAEKAGTAFDLIRSALHRSKIHMSARIKENHGITAQHLRDLFLPLGIDVPDDQTMLASLAQIVLVRHQWAHQCRFSQPRVAKGAADVKIMSDDCLRLAADIARNARAAVP